MVLILTLSSFSRGTKIYAVEENVRHLAGDVTNLKWRFSHTKNQTSNNMSCYTNNITCYAVKNNRAIFIGKWSSDVVNISSEIETLYERRLSLSCASETLSLTISNSVYQDSGMYTCTFKNVTAATNLIITGGPMLRESNFTSTVTVNEGSFVNFHLVFCGNPPPQVKWKFKGTSTLSKYYELRNASNANVTGLRRTYCFRYEYSTPVLYRDTCQAMLSYELNGSFANKTTILVKHIPEDLKNVRTLRDREKNCLTTKWDAPLVKAGYCQTPYRYYIRFKGRSFNETHFNSYTSNFQVCNDSLPVDDVTEISVTYSNQFGNGTYVKSEFVQTVVGNHIDTSGSDYKTELIAVSCLLGLILLAASVAVVYFVCKRYCKNLCRKTTKVVQRNESVAIKTNDGTRTIRVKKNDIIHKPRPLSHVIAKPVTKSNTFHGLGYVNRYVDESALQKSFMPLNTLQRRISESLEAYGHSNYNTRISIIPTEDSIIENNNVEYNRLSGASGSSEPTPDVTRRAEKQGLSRMSSLNSIQSEYDRPQRHPSRHKKRRNEYDLPRSHTFNNATRPNVNIRAHSLQNMYELNPLNLQSSEYDLPRSSRVIRRRKESETSDYSTPRHTLYDEEDDDDDDNMMSDNVEYDKPRIDSVGSPCSSREHAIYDTPRTIIRQLQKSHSIDPTGLQPNFGSYNNEARRTTVASENLYDNIKSIIGERGGKLETNLYEELPIKEVATAVPSGTEC